MVSAVGWVQRNAARYGIDASRVSLGGTSAGGTLALNAAYRLRAGTISPSIPSAIARSLPPPAYAPACPAPCWWSTSGTAAPGPRA
ncbi:alpha/beta hydrolase [Streptomyces goshikiensis]|uniref:alpha/beta hydrolase n=1 Tax=Streptomyces goshikiensis TaxID=1942 RepID=UPI0036C63819